MAATTIRFDIDIAPAMKTLSDNEARLADFTEVLEKFADIFHKAMAEQFASEGAYLNDHKWSALTPAYAAEKERNYPGKPILDRTGAMMRSFIGEGSGAVTEIGTHEARLGSDIAYAKYHQTGTSKMVARPILKANDELSHDHAQLVLNHIKGLDSE